MVPAIYTSYYGKLNKIDTEKYSPINIAGKQPDGVSLPTCKELVPPKSLVFDYKDGKIKKSEYVYKYNEQLDKLTVIDVLGKLMTMADGKTPVLMCYERPEAFCHRQLVLWWIKSYYTITAEELGGL